MKRYHFLQMKLNMSVKLNRCKKTRNRRKILEDIKKIIVVKRLIY